MQMAVIIDGILAAVLIVCAVLGWRRGAFKSVMGIVVVLVALVGAGVISNAGAPVAAKTIAPIISQQIETRVDHAAQSVLPEESGDSLDEETAQGLFSAMGLYQKTAENMAKNAMEQATQTGQTMMETAMENMIQSAAAAVLFFLSFIILLILLKLVSNVLGLLTAVPGLHLMNAVGGAVFGLIQGVIILIALIWAVQFFAGSVPAQVADETVLFRLLAALNPIALVSGV